MSVKISNLPAASAVVAGDLLPSTQTDLVTRKITFTQVMAGLSLVTGPASSVDNTIPRFDGTTGKVLQTSSGVYIDDNGRLGVGTPTPPTHFGLYGTDNTVLNVGPNTSTFWGFTFIGQEITNASNVANTVAGTVYTQGTSRMAISAVAGIQESTTLGALALFTGGSGRSNSVLERMRIDSAGRVGIGTNSPSSLSLFHVYSATAPAAQILENANATNQQAYTHYKTANGSFYVGKEGVTAGQIMTGNTAHAGVINTLSNVPLQFGTNDTVRMTILGTGLVGVGTDAPNRTLHVNGNTTLGAAVTASYVSIPSTPQNNLFLANATGQAADVGSAMSLGGRYRAADDGQVAYGSIAGMKENSTNSNIDGYMSFYTASDAAGTSVERMRIKSTGAVGIGTTSPSATLDVAGSIRRTPSANNGVTHNKVLYGATTDAATAVELTTDGAAGSGATNRIAVPTDTAFSVLIHICVKKSGTADAWQMLRQFVISNNGGTTALQGAVTVLGTDIGSAALNTVTTTITANNTDDCISVVVNGVAATNLRYTASIVSCETLYA